MNGDDLFEFLKTFGFPVVFALWLMRLTEKYLSKILSKLTKIIRALSLMAQAQEAKQALEALEDEVKGDE